MEQLVTFLKRIDAHVSADPKIELYVGGGAAILLAYEGELAPIRRKTRREIAETTRRSVGSELEAVFANLTERGVGKHADFGSDDLRSLAFHDRGHD
jgi:hypothetical protein